MSRPNNNCSFIGRLVRDVECRTAGEHQVYNFTIAVDRPKFGNKDSQADFVRCESWNKQGETISKYFSKGDPISIVGELRINTKKNDDGTTSNFTSILVSSFTFLPSVKSSDNKTSYDGDTESGTAIAPSDDSDNLPF